MLHKCVTIIFIILTLSTIAFSTTANSVNVSVPDFVIDDSTKYDNASLYRLPKQVRPESYELLLFPQIAVGNFTYEGEVRIHLQVLERTNSIKLHVDKLSILKDESILEKIVDSKLQPISISHQQLDNNTQFFIFSFAHDLEPGKYILSLTFVGEVLDDVFGFYRSSYKVGNETRWIGVTQFSPAYARRAFPCMDEPGFKASFRISIGHYGNETITGNTLGETQKSTRYPNYYITTLATTPRMSTYLVGWAVHNFSQMTSSNTNIHLWARNLSMFDKAPSVTEGPKIYATLEKLMMLKNPIKKLDLFAVPDFYFNAMENWGIITFRESALLIPKDHTPTSSIHSALTTMAHEFSHTWFGNIVTPDYWYFAWMKEGFSTFFEYFVLDLVHPDWKMMNHFVGDLLHPALLADSEEHNRTMNDYQVAVDTANVDVYKYGFISYNKASSVIRMMQHVIGEAAFQLGLRKYLEEYAYESVTPPDLYKHLQAAYDKYGNQTGPLQINTVMETWADQPGYPIVTISRNYSDNSAIASQTRFQLSDEQLTGNISQESSWSIPLSFASKSRPDRFTQTSPYAWLLPKGGSVRIDGLQSMDWVIFNVQQVGYYRVNYDTRNWDLIMQQLRSEEYNRIPVLNRAQLLDDAFNIARAGYIDYGIPLNLSKYLIREMEYEPWLAAINSAKFLDKMLRDSPDVQSAFRKHFIDLLRPVYDSLTFDEHSTDSLMRSMHRSLILSTACTFGMEHCREMATSMFTAWLSDNSYIIPANFKSFVYCLGVQSQENSWPTLWNRFLEADLHTDMIVMINGLGCTDNPDFLYKYLEAAIRKDVMIPKQYRQTIFKSVLATNSQNIHHVIHFLEQNWNNIVTERGNEFLSSVITMVGNEITTEAQLLELKQFVNHTVSKLEGAAETGKTAIKAATKTLAWIAKYMDLIKKHLYSNSK